MPHHELNAVSQACALCQEYSSTCLASMGKIYIYTMWSHFGTSSTSTLHYVPGIWRVYDERRWHPESMIAWLLALSHLRQGSGLREQTAIIGEISCVGPQAWHWITHQSPTETPSRGANKQRCLPPANLRAGLSRRAAGSNTFNWNSAFHAGKQATHTRTHTNKLSNWSCTVAVKKQI